MKQELLFSITAKDCEWQYVRGTGKGGQKRNKTSSKVRCFHKESGAIGVDDSTRSQHKNKSKAFLKMVETKKFKAWHKMEVARKTGMLQQVEETVDKGMSPNNIKVELKENGKWVNDKNNKQ